MEQVHWLTSCARQDASNALVSPSTRSLGNHVLMYGTVLLLTPAGALADLVRNAARITRLDVAHCTFPKNHPEAVLGIA
eukprot:scaffold51308_cov18-Tisochrysis_lutea.AAC.1